MRWGLIPSWAKDAKIGNSLINARGETVAEKPAFRAAFKVRRCLIPTGGFYEWQATGGKHKQPYHIRMRDGRPFALAGLWESCAARAASRSRRAPILTTAANELVRPVHDRMPVIIAPGDFSAWLDPRTPPEQLHALLRPYPAEQMDSGAGGELRQQPAERGAAVPGVVSPEHVSRGPRLSVHRQCPSK